MSHGVKKPHLYTGHEQPRQVARRVAFHPRVPEERLTEEIAKRAEVSLSPEGGDVSILTKSTFSKADISRAAVMAAAIRKRVEGASSYSVGDVVPPSGVEFVTIQQTAKHGAFLLGRITAIAWRLHA